MRIYNRNKNKKIEITRRDTGVFDITSKTYEMAEGDTATFTVKKYLTDTQPVISKTIHPLTESFSLSRTNATATFAANDGTPWYQCTSLGILRNTPSNGYIRLIAAGSGFIQQHLLFAFWQAVGGQET